MDIALHCFVCVRCVVWGVQRVTVLVCWKWYSCFVGYSATLFCVCTECGVRGAESDCVSLLEMVWLFYWL